MSIKIFGICIIGAGFVGMKHASAYSMLDNTKMQIACDSNIENANRMAKRYRFQRTETNWEKAVADENVDIVCICVPNHMHYAIAKAAIENDKYVVCEKPLGMNSAESVELAKLASTRFLKTSCCYNLIYTPAIQYIKSIIDNAELGELVCFRGAFDNDRLADSTALFEWRMNKKVSRGGAICDLGLNIISISQYLFGDIKSIVSMTYTVYRKRYDCNGIACEVENEDIAQFIYEYKEKGMGYISCNRIAPGSKQDMKFEIQFTKGAIRYSLERLNEVLIYRIGNYGYETVISDQNGWFNIGYENLKEIDAQTVVSCISNNIELDVNFGFAAKVDRVIECVLESAEKKTWVSV